MISDVVQEIECDPCLVVRCLTILQVVEEQKVCWK